MTKPASGDGESQIQPSLFGILSPTNNSAGEQAPLSDTDTQSVAEVIEQLGWRQGSIIPSDLYQHIHMDDPTISVEATDIVVVITGDCNIVHKNTAAEPIVEVVVGRVIEKLNGNYTRRKNPRLLHIKIDGMPGAIGLEFETYRHGNIPRTLLASTPPDRSLVLSEDSRRMIVSWWAIGRYLRSSFPNSFNERVQRLNTKRRFLEQLLEAKGDDIVGIYVRLFDERELPEDQPYRMIVRVLVPESLMSDPVAWAAFDEETYGPLIARLDSDIGIDVVDHLPVSTKDFSYEDMLEMKLLEYEYLSFGGDEGNAGSTTSLTPSRG